MNTRFIIAMSLYELFFTPLLHLRRFRLRLRLRFITIAYLAEVRISRLGYAGFRGITPAPITSLYFATSPRA